MTATISTFNPMHARAQHMRMRPDLQVSQRWHRNQRFWAVQDPVADRYYLLRDEEYFILRQLDGTTDVTALRDFFAERFAPRRLSAAACWQFLTQLYRDGLVISDREAVSHFLDMRAKAQCRSDTRSRWLNPLFLKFPLLNPTRHLQAIYPHVSWIYSSWFLAGCTAAFVLAILFVTHNSHSLQSKFPEYYELFSSQNLLLYAGVYAVIKLFHECGHAMTCLHFGGQVRELGIRLMFGVPCLYCDISGSWMIARRRHRTAVAAAGIAVELVIASLACVLWWFTEPGPLNAIARSVMLVGSISTFLINANPLMRFDGYFVLAELLDAPNLWTRSRSFWQEFFCQHVLGITLPNDPGLPVVSNFWLGLYGAASYCYQWCVTLGIIWIIRGVLNTMLLDFLFPFLAFTVCLGLLLPPLRQLWKIVCHPALQSQADWKTAATKLGVLTGIVSLLGIVPLPYRVTADATITPKGAHPVYVREEGVLRTNAHPGQSVVVGEVLAEIENLELKHELAVARGQRERQRLHVESLDVQRLKESDDNVRNQRIAAMRQLEVLDRRCESLEKRVADLTLRAPCDGMVYSPQLKPEEDDDQGLAEWSGSPLDAINEDAWMASGTPFCTVGAHDAMEAWVHVDQRNVRRIDVGQHVVVYLQGMGCITLRGRVLEVAEVGTKVESRDVSHESSPLPWFRPQQLDRPVQTWHQVRVAIETDTHPIVVGMQGRAKIRVSGKSVLERIIGYWRSNVRWS